jgi:RNA polymerase sigma-70 factor (ECF subfamily)
MVEGGKVMTVEELVLEYNSMLYNNCMVILCNEQDAQDAVQDTFCRYIERTPDFKDKEHEKAWLMRVATNRCIDIHRFRAKHPIADIEETKTVCVLCTDNIRRVFSLRGSCPD